MNTKPDPWREPAKQYRHSKALAVADRDLLRQTAGPLLAIWDTLGAHSKLRALREPMERLREAMAGVEGE